MAELPVVFSDILKACDRIAPFLHRTPIFTSCAADELAGRKLVFKAENLQKTGSFKVRGALNAILCAKDKQPSLPGISDEEMKFVTHRMKLVVEMAAGASVAAALSQKMKAMDPALRNVGVILCGGNIDLHHLPW